MNEVEANVAGNLLQGAVVLDQGVQEHAGAEGVVDAAGDQIGGEIARGQIHIVVFPGNVHHKLVIGLEEEASGVGVLVAVKELPDSQVDAATEHAASVAGKTGGDILEHVVTHRNVLSGEDVKGLIQSLEPNPVCNPE